MPGYFGVRPEEFESVPCNLGTVERFIREVEAETGWRFALPGRCLVYQLFTSLAADQGGFNVVMHRELRMEALRQAEAELPKFLRQVVSKAQSLPSKGEEVGFAVLLHELDKYAVQLRCGCWPR